MSCSENADLNELVCCCSGQVTAILLAFLFFLNGSALAGSLIWQHFEDKETNPEWAQSCLVFLVLPATFIVTTFGLCGLLACHKKIVLFVCMLWPLLVSAVPIWFIVKTFDVYNNAVVWNNAAGVATTNIVVIALPICSAFAILCSLDCLLMLCCMACCARSTAGADLFDLEEAAGRDESSDESDENPKLPKIQ